MIQNKKILLSIFIILSSLLLYNLSALTQDNTSDDLTNDQNYISRQNRLKTFERIRERQRKNRRNIMAIPPRPAPQINNNDDLVTRRTYLFAREIEKKGFGLYSYILFAKRAKEECIKCITSIFKDINQYNFSEGIEKKKINITYYLKKSYINNDYDFDRAVNFLKKVNIDDDSGIYVVSSIKPLTSIDTTEEIEDCLIIKLNYFDEDKMKQAFNIFLECVEKKDFSKINLKTFVLDFEAFLYKVGFSTDEVFKAIKSYFKTS